MEHLGTEYTVVVDTWKKHSPNPTNIIRLAQECILSTDNYSAFVIS